MPLLSGLEILIIAQSPSSPQIHPKEGEPERDVIIDDFVISRVILLADLLCRGYFLRIEKLFCSVKYFIGNFLTCKLFIQIKQDANFKLATTETFHTN